MRASLNFIEPKKENCNRKSLEGFKLRGFDLESLALAFAVGVILALDGVPIDY